MQQLMHFHRSTLDTSKLPEWLWYECLNLLVAFNNKTQSRKLTTAVANQLVSKN